MTGKADTKNAITLPVWPKLIPVAGSATMQKKGITPNMTGIAS